MTTGRTALLVEHAMFAQKPGVHDLPLVPPPRLEVQQLGSPVLQVEIELERVATGCRARTDRLAREPAVPFPDNQVSQIPLFHFLRAQKWLEPGKRAQVVALVLRASSTMAPLARAPTESPFDVRMQQGRHWISVQSTS